MSYDVIVVGAGPAGSAAAAFLGARGWRVLLLDKATFPRDKICGEALAPGALPVLERMGARGLVEGRGTPVTGARIRSADGRMCVGRYPEVPGQPSHGIALSRIELDPLLLGHASRWPGVQVETGQAVRELLWDGDRCVGVLTAQGRIEARAVVLAEGRLGRLHPGMRRSPTGRRRMAFVATFEDVDGMDQMLELDLRRPDLQTVLSPQGDGVAALCVVTTGGPAAPLGAPPLDGLLKVLRESPEMAERLHRAKAASALKGMPLEPYTGDPAPAPGLVIVGDGLCNLDPITGEGMYRALRSAELAAAGLDEALRTEAPVPHLRGYAHEVTREFRWTYHFVDAVVMLSRSRVAGDLAVRGLAKNPALASRMIGYQGAILPAERFFPDMLRAALAAI